MGRFALIVVGALVVGLAIWAALPGRVDSGPTLRVISMRPTGRSNAPVNAASAEPAAAAPVAAPAAAAPAAAAPVAAAAPADLEPRLQTCLAAQTEVAARRRARGGPAPAGEPSDAAVVSRACAPLYREPGCRDAMMGFDAPPVEARAATVFQACARAYCPGLPAPKPAACANPGVVPTEQWVAWSELRRAILTRDLGAAAAERVLASTR